MKTKISHTQLIVSCLIIGMVSGIVLNLIGTTEISQTQTVRAITIILVSIFEIISSWFLNGIKFIMVPLVFFSITVGIFELGDIKKVGKIGGKVIGFYLFTTSLAIAIALIVGILINPGSKYNASDFQFEPYTQTSEPVSITENISGIVPVNIFQSFVESNMIQIIFIAVIFGVAFSLLKNEIPIMIKIFIESNKIMLKIVTIIMFFAPIGVFCLVSLSFMQTGIEGIIPLFWYIVAFFMALLAHFFVSYGVLFKLLTKLSYIQFLKNIAEAMPVAFSTSSSNATLPITEKVVVGNCGVNQEIAAFSLPLGATINMDGTAIMQGVAVVFIANIYGVELTAMNLLSVVILATIASIGTAGVPGVGLVMLSMVLINIGLPPEAIGIILGIDRILDMSRTIVNITGDSVCTAIIAKREGMLNEEIFNSPISSKENI